MNKYYPEGRLLETIRNQAACASPCALADACRGGEILEAKAVLCDSEHNLLVDLGCMKGLIPREETAVGIREGTVRDIAILSRVNRPVCFVITEFREVNGELTAILSRRKAQERCQEEYLSRLVPGDILDATVTHLESFGAFADIGCGVISLLPIDKISVSRIRHPAERLAPGMEIRAAVRCIEDGRITLSHKELLGTWAENAARFSPGETVRGRVRSVEPYGIFVELMPNLSGLAEPKEGVSPGQQASVFIKSILPDRMKIKLIIIDTFSEPEVPEPPIYFYQNDHIDRFVYSPPDCEKNIVTEFAPPRQIPIH